MAPKFTGKMALITETTRQGYSGQRFTGINESAAGHAEPQFSQVFLRSEVEASEKVPLKRTHRHGRHGRQLLVGDGLVVMISHEGQNCAEGPATARCSL